MFHCCLGKIIYFGFITSYKTAYKCIGILNTASYGRLYQLAIRIGDNWANECRPVSGNSPFHINNIVPGENYTISLSLGMISARVERVVLNYMVRVKQFCYGHTHVYGVCI